MRRKWILAVVLVLVLPALACSFSLNLGGETPEPTTPPPPTEIPTQAPPPPPSTEVATEAPPPPTPTLPAPAGPSFTNIFFAAGKTDAGDPINVATEFPPGPTIVYAFATWEGMTDGVQAESVWYHEGDEAVRTPFDWSMGSGGARWVAYVERDEGLWSGHYDWELWADDNLLATGSFAVRGEAPVLFQDDFSDPGSGWEVGDYPGGSVGYRDGSYVVTSTGGKMMWGLAYQSFRDVVIEVDATQAYAGPENDNAYGVMCRVQPNDDGYLLRVSGDGYYSIAIENNEEIEALVDWTRSDVIRQGDATNHLRAVCDGSDLVLFVNGELLGEASDSTFSEGDIALTASSYEEGESTEVHFDNLVVRAAAAR